MLIIDDDHDLLMCMKEYFEMESYEVLLARNGKDALDLLATVDEKNLPDMILLDHMMPVMDGTAFSRSRKNVPRISHIPVVLTTASGKFRGLMDEVEAEAYLQKPVDLDQLQNLSMHFIHRRLETQTGFLV